MERNNSKENVNSMCLMSPQQMHSDKDFKKSEIENSKCLITKSVNLDEAMDIIELKSPGFGSFHYYLLFICGSLFAAISISVTSVSFIIPSAQCDFKMTSVHKGILNGASMIGMFFGCFISGYLADSKGRKYTLIVCMLIDGIFNIISSVSQIYPILIFCKLMSGFGVSGVTVFYSYLGEFVSTKNREKYLCWMELFWTLGVILLPCIAWSWNLFAIICALPSLIFSCLLAKLPESPKFLLAKGKHDETIDCLKFVYRWNNKTDDDFPASSSIVVTSLTLPDQIYEKNNSFFNGLYNSILDLFTSKFKIVAINTCLIQFCSTASFYMMVLWFPELMNRFRWYETSYSGPKNMTNMCEIVSLFKIEPEEIDLKCNDEINQSVYENILIIGVACIPTSIIVPLLVNKFGIKLFLVLSFFGSGLSSACLYFITSSFENIVLSSIFEALSSLGIGLVFCISVELFSTELRGVAVAISSMFGKIGAVLGNIVVGVFIDAHCMVPIIVSCSLLIKVTSTTNTLLLTLPPPNRNVVFLFLNTILSVTRFENGRKEIKGRSIILKKYGNYLFILDAEDSAFIVAQPVHLDDAIEMVGMFSGSFIWGYVADSKGRRYALILCMIMDGVFSIISSVSQIYPVLIFCRLMSGFGVSGATVLYSYLGEFINSKYREKFLCWMEMFWTGGVILLPCVAWLIIPQTFRIEYGFFLFRSWNLFVIICAFPSLILAYLLVTSLILPDCINEQSNSFFNGLYESTVGLFTSKFKFIAIITCIIQYGATTSYYMLMLWFPELMNRFRWYETSYLGPKNMTNMCEIVSMFKTEPEKIDQKCNDDIDQSVYLNIIIIGIACIPTSLIVPLFVNKLGLRFFLVVSFLGSGLSAALLYFITSSLENLVLSSVFEALSSVGISLMYCIAVELFPTEYRGMAVSIGSTFGKIGALMGNIVVGVFIDELCVIPIFVSCSFLIISGLLVLTLPKTGRTNIK
ncbi:hypothetical protein AGLY_012771 [Aphis glycines]|uniref:Major facilitator superfamily (MFS) profile domain-containing protein n=1 Tax=Aphis glycines TaxID=307491 RepID=A0A6G0T828_APHGL|nr:hypothetical protein AGLY_012771 [Aphis glycines]